MNLGLAIFASVVLILMVYHAKFRKVMFWLAGVLAVGVGLFYLGLYLYNAHEERVQKAEAEAAQKAWKASVAACETRFAANGWNGAQACLLTPGKAAPPIAKYLPLGKWIDLNGDLMDVPQGMQVATINGVTQLVKMPIPSTPPAPKTSFTKSHWAEVVPAATQIYKRCYFNAVGSISAFEACGYSSGEIAQVHAGDRVQILSDVIRAAGGDEIVEVKLQQWVGWMPVAELSRLAP